MTRRFFTLAAAASLLALLAVVGLLVLSIVRPGQFVWGSGPGSLVFNSSGAELSAVRAHYDPAAKATYVDRPGDAWHVQYVYPAAAAAILPLAWLVRRLGRRPAARRTVSGDDAEGTTPPEG